MCQAAECLELEKDQKNIGTALITLKAFVNSAHDRGNSIRQRLRRICSGQKKIAPELETPAQMIKGMIRA